MPTSSLRTGRLVEPQSKWSSQTILTYWRQIVTLTQVQPWANGTTEPARAAATGWNGQPFSEELNAAATVEKIVRKANKRQAQSRVADHSVLVVDCSGLRSYWDLGNLAVPADHRCVCKGAAWPSSRSPRGLGRGAVGANRPEQVAILDTSLRRRLMSQCNSVEALTGSLTALRDFVSQEVNVCRRPLVTVRRPAAESRWSAGSRDAFLITQ